MLIAVGHFFPNELYFIARRNTGGVTRAGLRPDVSHDGGAKPSKTEGGASSNRPPNGGKRYQYEGGVRVPFIRKWPGRRGAWRVVSFDVLRPSRRRRAASWDYPLISRGELAHDNPAWVQAAKAGQLVLQRGS